MPKTDRPQTIQAVPLVPEASVHADLTPTMAIPSGANPAALPGGAMASVLGAAGQDGAALAEQAPARGLAESVEQAWEVTWKRFYRSDTQLLYDYLSSYEPGCELRHLPTAAEVARQYPNPYGYGTGMEDCMISAGAMLSALVDRYAVTGDQTLRERACSVFQGIQRCATAHGVPGFLARGVCHEDPKSIYVNSSRDQYTHAVHGLWLYSHSPLCSASAQPAVGEICAAIADRMTRNVTPENDYDSLRADGARDRRGISRMWNVMSHEAARLPTLYAAAWDTTGRREYYERYRTYVVLAIEQSLAVEGTQPTYALLQMQCSLELLARLEQDAELAQQMRRAMAMVSARCATRAVAADRTARGLDLTMVGPDWRQSGGLVGEYRKAWYCIRESGEAALTQLLDESTTFPAAQADLLARAITRLDYERVSSCGIFHLQAAYWKARRRGLFGE